MTAQTARPFRQNTTSRLRAAWGRDTYRHGSLLLRLALGMVAGVALLAAVGVARAFALVVGAVVVSDLAALAHSWTLLWREQKHGRLDMLRLALEDQTVVANAVRWGWLQARGWCWGVVGARLLVVAPTAADVGRGMVFRPYSEDVLWWQGLGAFTGAVVLVLALLFALEPLARGFALVRLGVAVSAGAVNRVWPVVALGVLVLLMLGTALVPLALVNDYRVARVGVAGTIPLGHLVLRTGQVLAVWLTVYGLYAGLGRAFVRRTIVWLRAGSV